MALDPNGAPAEYFYELGAIAYLINPAGTSSLPTTDPAGTTSPASASAPTPTYIPVTGANSVAAEVVDSSAAYSAAVASPPTTDPASTYSPAVRSAPSADPASTYSPAVRRAPSADPASAYSAASASALMMDPAGAYSPAGPSAPSADPAGALVAAAAHLPVTGATSAGSEIVSPPGTYLPSGVSAPIADPGGTYSAAGASAPTIDPAGTYTSPYALDRLFVEINSIVPVGVVMSFGSATAVANYFGASSSEASLATEFFEGYAGAPAQMLLTNYPYAGEPAQLLGGDVTSLTQVPKAASPTARCRSIVHWSDLHGQRQSVRRSEFLRRGGRVIQECVQYELAGGGQDFRRPDHARLRFRSRERSTAVTWKSHPFRKAASNLAR